MFLAQSFPLVGSFAVNSSVSSRRSVAVTNQSFTKRNSQRSAAFLGVALSHGEYFEKRCHQICGRANACENGALAGYVFGRMDRSSEMLLIASVPLGKNAQSPNTRR